MTEAHRCEKLAQGFYAACPAETRTHDLLIASPTLYHSATTPLNVSSWTLKHTAYHLDSTQRASGRQIVWNRVKGAPRDDDDDACDQ